VVGGEEQGKGDGMSREKVMGGGAGDGGISRG
jgi:hypothetical protein